MTVAMVHRSTAQVKGGFWPDNGISSLSGQLGSGFLRRRAAYMLSRRGTLPLQKVMSALNGVAPGATATKNLTRIAAAEDLSGRRTIETVALVDVATAAGDVTRIAADVLSYGTFQTSPVTNGNGNPLNQPGL